MGEFYLHFFSNRNLTIFILFLENLENHDECLYRTKIFHILNQTQFILNKSHIDHVRGHIQSAK